VLRNIFRSKRDEVIEKWRGLLNEELSDLYSSPILFWQSNQENEMCWPCSMYGGEARCMEV